MRLETLRPCTCDSALPVLAVLGCPSFRSANLPCTSLQASALSAIRYRCIRTVRLM